MKVNYLLTYLCLVQLMEAMQRRDEVAIVSFGNEAQKIKSIGDQLECHTLGLAPSIALFLEF
jgi:hypothetical protein